MMNEQAEPEEAVTWEGLVERDEAEYQQWLSDQEDPDE